MGNKSVNCCCSYAEEEEEFKTVEIMNNTMIEDQGAVWDYMTTDNEPDFYMQIRLFDTRHHTPKISPIHNQPLNTLPGDHSHDITNTNSESNMGRNNSSSLNKTRTTEEKQRKYCYMDNSSYLYKYNPYTNTSIFNKVKPSHKLPLPKFFGYTELHGIVYMTGGSYHYILNSFLMIDCVEAIITRKLANMRIAKHKHGQLITQSLNGSISIITIGGEGKYGPISACEIY